MIFNLIFTSFTEEHANTMVIDVSLLLQILCFLMLIPHFIITTAQLHPSYIINKLLRTVNDQFIASLEGYYRDERLDVPSVVLAVSRSPFMMAFSTISTTLRAIWIGAWQSIVGALLDEYQCL